MGNLKTWLPPKKGGTVEMKLGRLRVTIQRTGEHARSGTRLSSTQLDRLIGTWAPLPSGPDPGLLAAVSVAEIASADGHMRAKEILRDRGIVVVPRFLNRDEALAAGRRALALLYDLKGAYSHADPLRNYVVEVDSTRGYYDLVNDHVATINLRRNEDYGMVDIFNFDRLDNSAGAGLRQTLSHPHLISLIPSPAGERWKPSNLNVYVNRNVSHTRMFHADSYGDGQVKAFVYLTDVQSMGDGPYSYVVDSHTPGPYRDMNRALTKVGDIFKPTDAPLVDTSKILPVLAPAGSLVVSNQSGFHRGYPQASDHERVVAVLNILADRD